MTEGLLSEFQRFKMSLFACLIRELLYADYQVHLMILDIGLARHEPMHPPLLRNNYNIHLLSLRETQHLAT